MPKFSPQSRARLATCHPLLIELMHEVVISRDCTVLEGHRNEARQNRLYDLGKSKVRWPHGRHNALPSRAVDAAPYFAEVPHVRWPNPESPQYVRELGQWYLFIGYVQRTAEEMGVAIRCGADWDGDDLVGDQDQAMVVSEMNRLLSWITELNIANAQPPVFAFVEEEDVQDDRAERDGKLHTQGVDFTPAYYQRTYNLEPDDFTLRATAAPAISPAFAEAGRGFTPEQQILENLGEASVDRALPEFTDREAAILEVIRGAGDFAEAKKRLQALGATIDDAALSQFLQESLFAADLFGRWRAREEADAGR